MDDELQFPAAMKFELMREEGSETRVALTVSERHRQANGVVHGSVIHGLLDTIMGVQVFRANGRKPCATSEISIRYLQPVFDGRLEATARVLKAGKRLNTVEGTVWRDGDAIAVGQSTFVTLRED